jgi:serine/threonine-protein kinase RsbW
VVVTSVLLELPTADWTVGLARRALFGLLHAAGVPAAVSQDLALALSEGCANAVCHAAAGQSYRVRIDLDHSQCRLEICDQGSGFDPHLVPAPGRGANGGRGLLIMRTVVDHVKIDVVRPRGTTVVMIKSWHGPSPARQADDRVHDQRAQIV